MIIANAIQKHHKPLKAVTEPLNFDDWFLNYRSVTTAVVFSCVNFSATILSLLAEFQNASLRLADIIMDSI